MPSRSEIKKQQAEEQKALKKEKKREKKSERRNERTLAKQGKTSKKRLDEMGRYRQVEKRLNLAIIIVLLLLIIVLAFVFFL